MQYQGITYQINKLKYGYSYSFTVGSFYFYGEDATTRTEAIAQVKHEISQYLSRRVNTIIKGS